MKRSFGIGLALLLILGGLTALAVGRSVRNLSQYPTRKAMALHRELTDARGLQPEKRLELEASLLQYETDNQIKIWTAVVQALGGAALLIGLLFTAWNLKATQDKLDIDRQGQLTNRFIQATGQLGAELEGGKPNIEVRLGGIYALNRISNDWPKDYWPIADVLTAYVRHNAKWLPSSIGAAPFKPSTEIQAILTVLGHSNPPEGVFNDRHKFDLRNTDLRGAEFWDAHLEFADFWGAHLEDAKFWGAFLRNAKLDHASLAGANLRAAKLRYASLDGADFAGAIFDGDTEWPDGFDIVRSRATKVT